MKEIKELLLQNPIHIENILISLGFHKVHKYNKGISCCNSASGKGMSIHVKLDDNISCKDYKYNVVGDIFSFIMKKKQLELFDVLNIVKQELGVDSFTFAKKNTNKVFGGVYHKIKKNVDQDYEYTILDSSVLIPYLNKFNLRFLRDGISLETQKKFKIGMDFVTQRITVPWCNYNGELIGIMGRYTGYEEEVPRWLPVIPFPKINALYGYSNNYKDLVECDELYIFESEKGVLKADTLGINSCVALGRNEISSMQIKRLISLNPKKIIYCLDESLPEEISIKNVKLTQSLIKYRDIKVGYIYDNDNDILPKGKKDSPIDLGKKVFSRLLNEKVKEVI
jgi:hypothetical protein